jgi:hypothetical protein
MGGELPFDTGVSDDGNAQLAAIHGRLAERIKSTLR